MNPALLENPSRRRGLKGLLIHLRPRLEKALAQGRELRGKRNFLPASYGWKLHKGLCRWCQEPVDSNRRRWHWTRILYYNAATGAGHVGARRPDAVPNHWGITPNEYILPPEEQWECHLCGKPSRELDHKVAIGVAAREGIRAVLRAFLPDNLQWLCHDCHVAKTREDRFKMSSLEGRKPVGKLL